MKKYIMVIALLTIASAKLNGMEENSDQQKILIVVNKLYNLANVPTEDLSNFENVLQKLSDFPESTEDLSKLREGIFAITSLLTFAGNQKNADQIRTLKTLQKSLYNRFTTLLLKDEKQFPTIKDAKSGAKDFCCKIIDDISDEEDEANEKNNYTQNNFDKYKVITDQILNTELYENELNSILEKSQNTQKVNSFQIETLTTQIEDIKKANDELSKQITYSQKESKALNIAHGILQHKASNQLKKMQKQREWLVENINNTNNSITSLQGKWSGPTDNDIARKNTEIANAKTKLTKLQNALSYLDKNFAEINGKTGTFSNIAWYMGLYNYGKSDEGIKKN